MVPQVAVPGVLSLLLKGSTMAVVFHHRGDRGVVDFSGELGFESGSELVRSIEVLVEDYHYDLVQIDVASPGGMVPAFDHFRLTLERFQAPSRTRRRSRSCGTTARRSSCSARRTCARPTGCRTCARTGRDWPA